MDIQELSYQDRIKISAGASDNGAMARAIVIARKLEQQGKWGGVNETNPKKIFVWVNDPYAVERELSLDGYEGLIEGKHYVFSESPNYYLPAEPEIVQAIEPIFDAIQSAIDTASNAQTTPVTDLLETFLNNTVRSVQIWDDEDKVWRVVTGVRNGEESTRVYYVGEEHIHLVYANDDTVKIRIAEPSKEELEAYIATSVKKESPFAKIVAFANEQKRLKAEKETQRLEENRKHNDRVLTNTKRNLHEILSLYGIVDESTPSDSFSAKIFTAEDAEYTSGHVSFESHGLKYMIFIDGAGDGKLSSVLKTVAGKSYHRIVFSIRKTKGDEINNSIELFVNTRKEYPNPERYGSFPDYIITSFCDENYAMEYAHSRLVELGVI